ncbi:MAG: type II toxin-antitoxin system VapC family toxin [Chthoniobacterales bacterium]
MVLIDTHVWVWWIGGLSRLPEKYRDALRRLHEPPLLSVISLWEVSLLAQAARIDLAPDPRRWMARATRAELVRLVQIDGAIAAQLLELPRTLPRDPADRIIAATARTLQVPVLTVDRQLLASGAVRRWDV